MKKIFLSILVGLVFTEINAQFLSGSSEGKDELVSLNTISVTIGGEFIIEGTFVASSTERVDQFITRIYNETRAVTLSSALSERTLEQAKSEVKEFAKRNIKLKRFDGEEIILDLAKFRLTGDFSYNPYLKNDDVIIFPELDLEKNFIEIDGAVNKPVKFQFVNGDHLSDALLLAYGIDSAYENVTTSEISRLSYDGRSEKIIKLRIGDEFALQRGDRIRIVAEDSKKDDFKVLVLGEVKNPGYIYITNGTTTIKEVIEKAGGFTEKAFLRMSELIRGTDPSELLHIEALGKNETLEKLYDLRMSNSLVEDNRYFAFDNDLRYFQSSAVVNFEGIYDENSEDGKFIVEDGDIILVPEKKNTIYIFGQVKYPGYIDYINGKNVEYYIEKAGGLGEIADDIKIIRAKSKEWLDADNDTKIEVGDLIYIFKDPPKDFWYYFGRVNNVAGFIGSVATLVLLLNQFGK